MTPIRFGEPEWLPLLAVPGALLVMWAWQFARRRGEARRFFRRRRLPVRERAPVFGDLLFWLLLILALTGTILAVARPQAIVSRVHTAGIDLVILQDGSASMRVADVRGDRWQRSMRFLRVLGESLRWEEDRVALALFARIATPQMRLTRDPNTLFFFLDHLDREPPFRLEDDGTWDTNIEQGVYWGLRLVEKDEEMGGGPATNARAFVLVSDGQAWSGQISRSLSVAVERGIPVHVVGVGTTAGGPIPPPRVGSGRSGPVLSASLDRESLAATAADGGGRYFELDREGDAEIATAIIAATRARATGGRIVERTRDLYWEALLAAAVLLVLGSALEHERAAIALHLAAGAVTLAWLSFR
ncbi:MAG TPA: vWA domain-containing protein [Vicinamibacterales bacterium]|nr:vWA domain-containing protein [Vicinamibacterales bacterium]